MCLLFYTYSKRKFVSNKIGNFLENDFWAPALRSPPPPINFVHDFISIFKVFLQSYGRSAWPPSLSQLRGGGRGSKTCSLGKTHKLEEKTQLIQILILETCRMTDHFMPLTTAIIPIGDVCIRPILHVNTVFGLSGI